MNVLTQTWRQLVRRRLWPVALLLAAALVAVPLLLAKPATPAPAAPAAASAAAPVATPAKSYVELASDKPAKRRRVLGAPKDPFEPAPLPKVKHHKHAKHKAATATATATATPATSAGSPATTGGAPSAPSAPVATATPTPVEHIPANSVEVGFGKTGGDIVKSTLTRLKTLPSASAPLVVFMGLHEHGRVAEFMLTGNVTAEGDGTCTPNVKSCETLLLHRDETEFLTFTGTAHDGEYELDVNALHRTKSVKPIASPTPTP